MAKFRKKKYSPRFVMLEHKTLKGKEWKSLKPSEKLIYIYIKANYNGLNNGEIPFRYSEVEFTHPTISNALKSLETQGWIEKTKHGGLFRFYCLYKLTGKYDVIRGY
jgi:uncharacterized membrane protein